MTQNPTDGRPAWYELSTPALAGASDFYASVLGWQIADAGMPGFTYLLGTAADGGMVAGMSNPADEGEEPRPAWVIYFASTDCDASAAAVLASGGMVLTPPSDIPGTGRFAICADPHGATFGILQPLPMEVPAEHPAFDQSAPSHGHWHELSTPDPEAALTFYGALFGWTAGDVLDMGEMGNYHQFQAADLTLGGMMPQGAYPDPIWVPYFGSDGVGDAATRIEAGGGMVLHGPAEVPGGAFIVIATDPAGATFGLVGAR